VPSSLTLTLNISHSHSSSPACTRNHMTTLPVCSSPEVDSSLRESTRPMAMWRVSDRRGMRGEGPVLSLLWHCFEGCIFGKTETRPYNSMGCRSRQRNIMGVQKRSLFRNKALWCDFDAKCPTSSVDGFMNRNRWCVQCLLNFSLHAWVAIKYHWTLDSPCLYLAYPSDSPKYSTDLPTIQPNIMYMYIPGLVYTVSLNCLILLFTPLLWTSGVFFNAISLSCQTHKGHMMIEAYFLLPLSIELLISYNAKYVHCILLHGTYFCLIEAELQLYHGIVCILVLFRNYYACHTYSQIAFCSCKLCTCQYSHFAL
jgi:hypothetical protein